MAVNFNRFFNDAVGVVKVRGNTLGKLMAEKKWVPVFLLLVTAVCLFTYITVPIQMAKMTENPQVTELLSEDQVAYFAGDSVFTRLMACVTAVFFMVLSLITGAFFVYLFFGIGGSGGVYANFFSLVVNASIIDILFPNLLNTFSLLMNTHFFLMFTNPGLYFFPPEPGSFVYLIMMRMDLFSIWYTMAIAAGVSLFSKMSFDKCMIISILYYIFKLIVGAATSYLFINIIRSPGM